eukprot:c18631_g1_i1 orf=235-1833(-)
MVRRHLSGIGALKDLHVKLQNERAMRDLLEQALGQASSVLFPVQSNFASQNARQLIKEIALLELEVANLEQHLLLLYQRAFKQHLDGFKVHDVCQCLKSHVGKPQPQPALKVSHKQAVPANHLCQNESSACNHFNASSVCSLTESQINRSTGFCGTPEKGLLQFSYSHPFMDMPHHNLIDSINLPSGEQIFKTPNKLSEELVHCMAAIYCKLAEPPLLPLRGSISPTSSSAGTFSPVDLSSDGWSPRCQTDISYDMPSGDSSQVRYTADNAAYRSMVEVPWICVDNDRLTYAARMLCNFRLLVQQLEKVDPGQMQHEEKLAFWINVYNALMMHAYLAYGIPRNNLKRVSLLQKAAYKIGVHSINAHTIEQSILGCHTHRPAQWLQTLLLPGTKFKGDDRQAYALDIPEPLVCFALCCGGQSDPVVRVYTAKNVYQELDLAKREYLRMSISIQNDSKVLLPRILESFGRESSIGTLGLLEWVCKNVSEMQRSEIRKCMERKHQKCIEWIPYNFAFRYIFVHDLARWIPSVAIS